MKNELTQLQKSIILKSIDKEMMRNYHATSNVWYIEKLNEIIDILDLEGSFKVDYCDYIINYNDRLTDEA